MERTGAGAAACAMAGYTSDLKQLGARKVPNRTRALGWAEQLANEFPDGWVYIHLEYGGEKD